MKHIHTYTFKEFRNGVSIYIDGKLRFMTTENAIENH